MGKTTVIVLLAAMCALASPRGHAAAPVTGRPLPPLPVTQPITLPEGELTLRVNDATVRPGGIAAAVIRTYASRGIGSGQLCFAVRQRVPDTPAFT
jgi:hypothetical protein